MRRASPLRHAIHGFEKPRSRTLPWSLGRLLHWGREPFELASNGDRRAPALWNLIDASGGSSIVVGWHNTYPAEPIRGVMVSNLLVWSRGAGPGRGPDQQPDPFTSGLIHPASQSEAVLDVTRAVEDALEREIVRFADFTPQELGRFQRESERPAGDGGDWSYFLRQAYVYDTIHARLAAQLLSERSPTATLVHLQALDLIGHNLLWFHRPEEFDAMDWSEQDRRMLAQATPRWGRTLTEFHVYLDEWLGELVALAGPHRAVLVLSDHGFEPNDDPLHSGHHEGAPPGIFVLAGPGLRRGVHIDASVYDVLPTVLALLGLPVARDLDGRVLEGAFCPDQLPPVRWVATFLDRAPSPPATPPPAALRRELEERLHSLGYTR